MSPARPGHATRPWLAAVGLLLLITAASLQLAASRAPARVESLYARGLYPLVARLGCLSALAPFSVAEVLVAALLGWLVYKAARFRRPTRFLGPILITAGSAYLAFLLLWGLNYQRPPFAQTAGLDTRPGDTAELTALAEEQNAAADQARRGLPEDEQGVLRLPGGKPGALARAGAGFREAARQYSTLDGPCARPKPLLTSALFSRLGITGIYFPFTAEAHVNVDVPDPELPFSASHELAHARGYAREDEANYLGYLACRLHPDPDFRYAGTLAASLYAHAALARTDRAAAERVEERRSPAVRRDIQALHAWAARHRGALERSSHRVNDAYLRSQGQVEGTRSYGRMVDLLLAERRARR